MGSKHILTPTSYPYWIKLITSRFPRVLLAIVKLILQSTVTTKFAEEEGQRVELYSRTRYLLRKGNLCDVIYREKSYNVVLTKGHSLLRFIKLEYDYVC